MTVSNNVLKIQNPFFSSSAISIAGFETAFPYETPYPTQIDFMKKVYQAIHHSDNAILESPTGCGKTACLLSTTLSYALHHRSLATVEGHENIKIIYASRTHSQLSQVASELTKLPFLVPPSVAMLAGRDRYCLNEYVRKQPGNAQGALCHRNIKACAYSQVSECTRKFTTSDIEDFMGFCVNACICPYLYSKDLAKTADIVLMPYNYLLSSASRKALGFSLNNSIVILDEAHNIAEAASEQMSIDLSALGLTAAISEIEAVMATIESGASMEGMDGADFKEQTQRANLKQLYDRLLFLKKMCLQLCEMIDQLASEIEVGKSFSDFPGTDIIQIFAKIGIKTPAHAIAYESTIHTILLKYLSQSVSRNSKGTIFLQRLSSLLVAVYGNGTRTLTDLFRLVVSRGKTISGAAMHNDDSVLSYWCFSGSVVMRSLYQAENNKPRSILLASGTLSPLPALKCELGIPFGVEFQGEHIVDPKRVLVLVVDRGPEGVLLDSSYKNRKNARYVRDLGTSILNFSSINPDGSMIFFPSFSYMEHCWEYWNKEEIGQALQDRLELFFEREIKGVGEESHDGKVDHNEVLQNFKNSVTQEKHALLFGVCRGKASEGLDFKDRVGRLVMIPGIPYPQLYDPRVVLKRQYLDENKKNHQQKNVNPNLILSQGQFSNISNISGQEWYIQSAMRAVNQAVGRIIRHEHDYGVICLMDSRFKSLAGYLPKWLSKRVTVCKHFGDAVKHLSGFYKEFADERTSLLEIEKKSLQKQQDLADQEIFNPLGPHQELPNSGIQGNSRGGNVAVHKSLNQHVVTAVDKEQLDSSLSSICSKFGGNKPKDFEHVNINDYTPAQTLANQVSNQSFSSPTQSQELPRYRSVGLKSSFLSKSREVKRPKLDDDVKSRQEEVQAKIASVLSTDQQKELQGVVKEFVQGIHTVPAFVSLMFHYLKNADLVENLGNLLPPKKKSIVL
ncbi:hypothetical protein GEMRC1_002432 [Eukaryota sp. GEM-RC1]